MKQPISWILAFLLVASAATLTIVANRKGWLSPDSPNRNAQSCPHTLTREDCPFCTPSLIEEKGFCGEHGVPEAFCSRCNAKLIPAFKAKGDWCGEHGLPESQCVICHPDLALPDQDRHPQAIAETIALDRVAEPKTLIEPGVHCQTENLRVRFTSPETARNAGFAYSQVQRREAPETLLCNAELSYDRNRYARLGSRAEGIVLEVRKDLGARVEADEVIAVLDAADLGTAKSEFLQAAAMAALWEKNHRRVQTLFKRGLVPEREALETETKLTETRVALSQTEQKLRNLGISGPQIQEIAENQDTSSSLALTAPFEGVVVERAAVPGEVVDTGKPLFAVADISRMWAILDVTETDVSRLQLGQPVVFHLEDLKGEKHGGRITWVSAELDKHTRTLKARAELENPDGLLRAGMFGKASVVVSDRLLKLLVPREAVQWEGCCNVVFVRESDTVFVPRKVKLGTALTRHYSIEEGLTEGDTVVTTGSFLLKTEILKGSIGAGCCEFVPGGE